MSDRGATDMPPSAYGSWYPLRHIQHLVFFIVVGTALVRLASLNIALCWEIVTVSTVLAVVYAAGLARWLRMGAFARHAWIATLILLWAVLVQLTPPFLTVAYVWCAVPLACAVLRALGRRGAVIAVAAITVVLVGQLTMATGRFDPEIVLIPVAAVWGTVALYRAQQRDAAERRRLVEELRGTRDVLAQEQRRAGILEERTRIARDLHDTFAQELSGSVMLLQAAERSWEERPDMARVRVRMAADNLSAGLAETRRIITDLIPSAVAEAGLAGALHLLCARAQQDEIAERVQFRSVGSHGPDLGEQATTLFRVAQSALANVREHAHATNVTVTLHHHLDHVELEVCDDGVGFDHAHLGDVFRSGRGLGLPSAQARLREYGGDLDVDSAPNRGTRIRATLPARRPSGPIVPVNSSAVS
ncbi:sensor histidine kinase [Saccharothrix stipae]